MSLQRVMELRQLLVMIANQLDSMKPPIIGPDGNDDTEAILKLMASDIRKMIDG